MKWRRVGPVTMVMLSCILLWWSSLATAKTTISFLHWDNEKTPVAEGVQAFEARNPDIGVEVVRVPRGEYDQKIITMAAGGVDMDVFYVPENKFVSWARMGWLFDISDNLRRDGLDKDFLPAEQMRSTVDGRWYGIGLTWNTFQLFYNPDMLHEAGVALPSMQPEKVWTWEQFVDAARKLHREGPDGVVERWGAQFPPNFFVLSSLLYSNNTSFMSDSGDATLDDPRAIAVFEAISDLFNVRRVARNAGSAGLLNNMAAMTFTGSYELGLTFKGTGFQPSVAALPRFAVPATYIFGPYHGVYGNTKNPRQAWELFKFLISEEYAELWISQGVWTPTRRSFMTPAKLRRMSNSAVHPDRYLEDTMSYISQVGRALRNPLGWETAQPTFAQSMGQIWNGSVPAGAVLKELAPRLNQIMAEVRAAF